MGSGIIVIENGFYKPLSWDGRGVPDVIAHCKLIEGDCSSEGFPFGIWSKKKFDLKSPGSISPSKIWPYIITKRCRGDIFAHM